MTLENSIKEYEEVSTEITRLSGKLDDLKDEIMGDMRKLGEPTYQVELEGQGFLLRASVSVRDGRESISVKEAKALLDPPTFAKLLKIGNGYTTFSVRRIKVK